MYESLPTKVSMAFYTRPDWAASRHKIQAKLVGLFCNTSIHHCGIMVSREDKTIVLASDKYHRAKFIDQEAYHQRIMKPVMVAELGTLNLSIKQMTDYMKEPYKGDARSIAFWFFIGRFLFPSLIPKSCSILSCQLLRIAGYHIKDCYTPIQLYNEVKKTGTIKSWQEFAEDNQLRS
jgi:hypothetical protein